MEHNKFHLVWAFMHANLTKLKIRTTMSIACNRCTKQKKLERAFPHTARRQTIGKSNTCHTVLTTVLSVLCDKISTCPVSAGPTAANGRMHHPASVSLCAWLFATVAGHFIEFTKHMLCDDFFNVVQLEHQGDFCSNPIQKR